MTRRAWVSALCCLLCAWLPILRAQDSLRASQIITRTWGADQGLAAGLIFSVAQTRDGYLWLGTEHGLMRFNGVRFDAVALEGRPADTAVLDLLTSGDGSLWMRTMGAQMLRLSPGDSVARPVPFLRDDAVLATALALDGGLIVYSASRGMLHVGADRVQEFGTHGPSMVVTTAQVGPRALWLGTRGIGLYYWEGGVTKAVGKGTISKKVNCLLPGDDGRLWIGTDQGLFVWNGHETRVVRLTAAGEPLQVLSLLRADGRALWVGTSQGVLRLDERTAVWVLHSGRAVTPLFRDRESDIWFGDGQALIQLQPSTVMPLNLPAAMVKGGVGAVSVDRHSRVWFAPLSGGLYWMTGDGRPHRVNASALDRDIVYSIDCRGDDVWVGRRDGGLTQLHIRAKRIAARTWTEKNGLQQNSIVAVRALADGSVWMGTLTHGASRLRNNRISSFGAESIGSNTVSAIEESPDGSVWFATPVGLVRYRDGLWQRGIAASGLPSQEVLSLLATNGELLVGTSHGLVQLDPATGSIRRLAPQVHDPVLGIAIDTQARLWVSTTDQLLSMPATEIGSHTDHQRIRSYDGPDGLVNAAGVRRMRSLVTDTNGTVFLTTLAGLFTVRPSSQPVTVSALSHVVSVLADAVPLSSTSPRHIPPNTRRTTVNFDGLDFRAPERVRFRYKLDGFEKDWSEPTTSHQVSYTNLAPGNYVFQLLAENSRGEWADTPATVALQVEPSLLQRWSFRLAVCALILVAASVFYQLRMSALLRRASLLADERIAERNRLARDLHDTLLQGFISITMHLDVATERISETSPTRSTLKQILDMMEKVIEEARLSVLGLRAPRAEGPDLEALLGAAGERLGASSATAYNFRIVGEKRPLNAVVADEISRIAMEAISNTFRHAQAETLEVVLEYSRVSLQLRVVDNGEGIDEDVLARGKTGHWGILGMRERAKHIGAQLEIQPAAGRGSIVILTLPARVAYRK